LQNVGLEAVGCLGTGTEADCECIVAGAPVEARLANGEFGKCFSFGVNIASVLLDLSELCSLSELLLEGSITSKGESEESGNNDGLGSHFNLK
jgi:hypothetical protein